jgi:phytoene dehydrogenase-like protein
MRPPNRRQMLYGAGAAGLGLAALSPWLWDKVKPKRTIPGGIVGANAKRGHRLREPAPPASETGEHHDVVIVGAGISGLSAAYALDAAGVRDLVVLELEDHIGGNSHSGHNDVSAYPWGAHYVPLLSDESADIKSLFRKFGIITGGSDAEPVYNEDYILNDPDERLYVSGRWQEGLLPTIGATKDDKDQYDRFLKEMDAFRHRRGPDGRRWFAIPVDNSSSDPEGRALDTVTMKAWMDGRGYTSANLHGFVDYGCRDDFGVRHDEISAYAGIHYFAGRNGRAANTSPDSVLVWPQGNGFLADRLAEPVKDRMRTGVTVRKVERTDQGARLSYYDKDGTYKAMTARAVVLAGPRFVSARLAGIDASGFSYAPWAVANITLDKMPEGAGTDLAWDNVIKDSQTLGYVVATHQVPQMHPLKTVITYYWPLTHSAPAEARREALARSYEDWQTLFLSELYRVHPELIDAVAHLDVWLWGHAMVRPVPGFIWGEARQNSLRQTPPIFTAHSDMSGMSIFEEAFSQGTRAARDVMRHLKGRA